jgi:LmbE family N-acetylglucosaminyl deacetylase
MNPEGTAGNYVRNYRILCVYAHPADICCEGAGTVALHAQRGDDVHVLLLSDGERHHSDLLHREYAKPHGERDPGVMNSTVDDIRAHKRREAQKMCEILGVAELRPLGWPDIHWNVSHDNISAVAEVIRAVRPDVVLTHIPKQNEIPGSDVHAMVGQIVTLACRTCGDSMPQIDGHEPHHVKVIFYFPDIGMADTAHAFGSGIVCNVWIDITPVVEKKIQAIDQCVSQGYQGTAARKIIEARDGRWGMLCGCSYAEPWVRERAPRSSFLPVYADDLDREFHANDLPGDLMIARDIPSAVPENAHHLPLE